MSYQKESFDSVVENIIYILIKNKLCWRFFAKFSWLQSLNWLSGWLTIPSELFHGLIFSEITLVDFLLKRIQRQFF
jgi:hypothetical protein